MKYHAHVYWNDAEQRAHAVAMRIGLEMLGCDLGRIHDVPIGPHPFLDASMTCQLDPIPWPCTKPCMTTASRNQLSAC